MWPVFVFLLVFEGLFFSLPYFRLCNNCLSFQLTCLHSSGGQASLALVVVVGLLTIWWEQKLFAGRTTGLLCLSERLSEDKREDWASEWMSQSVRWNRSEELQNIYQLCTQFTSSVELWLDCTEQLCQPERFCLLSAKPQVGLLFVYLLFLWHTLRWEQRSARVRQSARPSSSSTSSPSTVKKYCCVRPQRSSRTEVMQRLQLSKPTVTVGTVWFQGHCQKQLFLSSECK